jgi:hypothetical protein
VSFSVNTLQGVAGRPLEITFDNATDGVPHNIGIFDQSNTKVFTGTVVVGPKIVNYLVPALAAGTYLFHCDIHPNMTGILTMVAAPGASGVTPPGASGVAAPGASGVAAPGASGVAAPGVAPATTHARIAIGTGAPAAAVDTPPGSASSSGASSSASSTAVTTTAPTTSIVPPGYATTGASGH